jgi:beta-1,4-glucosyltransferase
MLFWSRHLAPNDDVLKVVFQSMTTDQRFLMLQSNDFDTLPLAGYPIISINAKSLSAMLQDRLTASKKTVLLFANTNFVLKCSAMRSWLSSEDVVIANDGIGLDIAALIVHGRRYRENLNGTDFSPYFLKSCAGRRKVFLLGGKPGVAEEARLVIEREFGHQVTGCLDGYSKMTPAAMRDEINRSGAEIILVAMGNPLQEELIRANMNLLDAKLFIGVGALLDFLSGNAQRAPRWIQQIHCEWLYRLCREPKRLMRRYTLDVVSFLFVCLNYQSQTKI